MEGGDKTKAPLVEKEKMGSKVAEEAKDPVELGFALLEGEATEEELRSSLQPRFPGLRRVRHVGHIYKVLCTDASVPF